jgi:glycosyltransferase involved in cell wall biosynthesis
MPIQQGLNQLSVSVVIPFFRASHVLPNALHSVLRQSNLPSEIIVVDDCSDDGSLEAIGRLRKIIPAHVRFLLVSLGRNMGPATARNVGWNESACDYVAFLDADDSWYPQKLQLQFQMMESNPGFYVTGHLHDVLAEGSSWPKIKPSCIAFREFDFKDFLLRNRLVTSTLMVRRKLSLRFPEGRRYMEDHHFLLQVAGQKFRLARIEVKLAAHHKADFGEGGLSGNLWKMEVGELQNYIDFFKFGNFGKTMLSIYISWSLLKYLRRLSIVALRQLRNRLTA